MYKNLHQIIEKNHVRNQRRKASLAKRGTAEIFGGRYQLQKGEEPTTADVLEALEKGEVRDMARNLAVAVGLGTVLSAGGMKRDPAPQPAPEVRMSHASAGSSLAVEPGSRKEGYLRDAQAKHGNSHGVSPGQARRLIQSHPELQDQYGPFTRLPDQQFAEIHAAHPRMGQDVASAHYDSVTSGGPNPSDWSKSEGGHSWLSDKFAKRT
jgi:hypothetical protein